MSVTITLAHILTAAPYLLFFALAYSVYTLHKRVVYLEKFNRGLIAASKKPPITTKQLIDGWRQRHDELEDSPKKTAYRNRLIEAGVMDKDGNYLDGD